LIAKRSEVKHPGREREESAAKNPGRKRAKLAINAKRD
jgi:hypothetical protein